REPVVVSCSALKRSYRDKLRESAPGGLAFVFLHGSESVLAERMHHRTGHFMPSSLLQTQLETLEDPRGEVRTVAVDVAQPLAEIVREALAGLARL
ncbi:gluconokinase, partial [Sinorhizobium meliloti]